MKDRSIRSHRPLPKSATLYVLKALIPYSRANLKLNFKPGLFYRDLEKVSRYNRRTIQNAFYLAKKKNLVNVNRTGPPSLTKKGLLLVKIYEPKLLGNKARLMIAFDIPEKEKWKRQHLRLLLKQLCFEQVQRSVWITKYDFRQHLTEEINQLDLQDHVRLFEVADVSTI